MGLDMYAYKVPKKFAKGDFEIDKAFFDDNEGGDSGFAYWRKHHDLHGFFEELYFEKGGEGEFNCIPVRLTLEDLERLEHCIKARELPPTTGPFFGDFPPDDESDQYDLEFVRKAREAISEGFEIYYDSWW
jgi:hypothetical protein